MPSLPRRGSRAAGLTAVVLAGLVAVAGCGDSSSDPPSAAAPSIEQDFVRVVKRVSPQVVQIQGAKALGSGVIFDGRGNIVTNAHVISGERQFVVTLSGGEKHPATVVGSAPTHDLAVVHMSGATPGGATFGDSSAAQVGDFVLAIGNPLGLQSSVTEGIVSSLNRSVSEGNGVTLSSVIQTSAAINPGNSGGALVDLTGHVIGIPTLAAADPQLGDSQAAGIGFAIPSNTVKRIASGLIGST